MNPDNIAISQIIRNLTIKQVLAIAAIIIPSVFYGGYWAGTKEIETQLLSQQFELRDTISQLKSELKDTQLRTESLEKEKAQLLEANNKTLDILTKKDEKISLLSDSLERANNCSFIQEQIIKTLDEMENTGLVNLNPSGIKKHESKKAILEKRIEGYQKILGTCNASKK